MAPLPASSDIHTDSWGNHRMGNFSIPVVVGFLTDMWGSHRGVAASATDREGIRRRSPAPENEQNSWRPLTTVLAIGKSFFLELSFTFVQGWKLGRIEWNCRLDRVSISDLCC